MAGNNLNNSLGWTRISFIGLNLIMLCASVGGFVFGNVKFSEGDVRMWSNGSFVGGWLSSACFVYVLYSILGIFAGWKGNLTMIYIYFSLTFSSFVLRLVNFVLFWAHGATLNKWTNYLFLGQELVMILLTIFLIIIMKRINNRTHQIIESEEDIVVKTSSSNKALRGEKARLNSPSKSSNPFEES